jgi:hypothetical protein
MLSPMSSQETDLHPLFSSFPKPARRGGLHLGTPLPRDRRSDDTYILMLPSMEFAVKFYETTAGRRPVDA